MDCVRARTLSLILKVVVYILVPVPSPTVCYCSVFDERKTQSNITTNLFEHTKNVVDHNDKFTLSLVNV